MMTGTVDGHREAIVLLDVSGPAGSAVVPAVIDTGFSGYLTLPPGLVVTLGLVYVGRGTAILADGSRDEYDVVRGDVAWFGVQRRVTVSAVGTEALVGMSLLDGCELRVEVAVGGAVEVRRLP